MPPRTNVVTLLFADTENSTRDLQDHGDEFRDALRHLQDMAHELTSQHRGDYANHTGDGFLLSFADPADAVRCSCALQKALTDEAWRTGYLPLRLRIGIHAGYAEMYNGQYDGATVWFAQRVMSAAHGTQIVLSDAAYSLVRQQMANSPGFRFEALGECRLPDLLAPLRLYRLWIEGLKQSDRPPRALIEGRHNLPEEDRPFVGRQADCDAVIRLFRERKARLVTITGIGGIGKTRLGKQVAAQSLEDYPDGVWLVELDALRDRDEIVPAISNALRMENAHTITETSFYTALASKRLLLLLDCFELLKEYADVIDRLLKNTVGVCCLVTSRKLLGIDREFEYSLGPMATAKQGSGRHPCESVVLFAEAASHVQSDFAVSNTNRAEVQEICTLVEGIPLSIVLAAAWLRHLSLTDLLAEVRRDRLSVLTRETVNPLDTRHADVRRVIEGSFCLLPVESQHLLHRLGLFVSGFDLEDAQYVCGAASKIAMAQRLTRLRESSMVQKSGQGERTRYRLLDTVREYLAIAERNASLEEDLHDCRCRHAERYLQRAREIDALMKKGRWTEGTAVLWTEIGNFRAAIDFSVAGNNHASLVDYSDALGRIYIGAGVWSDFDRLAAAAEDALRYIDRPQSLTLLLGRSGALARRRGQEELGRQLWERRFAECERQGHIWGCADSLFDLAGQAHETNDSERAQQLLLRSIHIAQQHQMLDLLATAYALQAKIAVAQGNLSLANERAVAAEALLRQDIDKDDAIYVNLSLGKTYLAMNDYARAEAVLHQTIRDALEADHLFEIGCALSEVGNLYERQQQWCHAARAYLVAQRVHTELGSSQKDKAVHAVAEFQLQYDSPEIKQTIQKARHAAWRDIVSELLDECST
jgi:predicted ATPase/class 3 adenylate cyclase